MINTKPIINKLFNKRFKYCDYFSCSSAIQAVQGAVQSTKQVGASKHDRVNAMAAANAGFDAYRAGDSVMKAGKSIQDFMDSGNMDSVVGVQITYGQQKNESRTHIEGNTAAKSKVNAGGKVNIGATGAGKDSNISIEGSDVSGKQGTFYRLIIK